MIRFRKFVRSWLYRWLDGLPELEKIDIQKRWLEKQAIELSRQAEQIKQTMKGRNNLSIDLGSGSNDHHGWINIDYNSNHPMCIRKVDDDGSLVINYDLRLGIPISDNTCSYIYSSHFLEHLDYDDGMVLLRDCYRILHPEGILRLAMPNYRPVFEGYLRGDISFFESVGRTRGFPKMDPIEKSIADYISLGIYENGQHRYIYDEQKLLLVLDFIGFRKTEISCFQKDMDVAVRQKYSFYIQGIK